MGEITPGERVGEMAVFTGETCTAGVAAVRDTALVKFHKAGFDRLMEKYPNVIRQITNIIMGCRSTLLVETAKVLTFRVYTRPGTQKGGMSKP